ncbi:hypothetical protein, partial [Photobacterium sp. BZF1]|uniref:hypothetical protein n=1 Tax=Photobacterium sp. BZF1 TaxID=1904457 RepID=UPI001CA3E4CB
YNINNEITTDKPDYNNRPPSVVKQLTVHTTRSPLLQSIHNTDDTSSDRVSIIQAVAGFPCDKTNFDKNFSEQPEEELCQ